MEADASALQQLIIGTSQSRLEMSSLVEHTRAFAFISCYRVSQLVERKEDGANGTPEPAGMDLEREAWEKWSAERGMNDRTQSGPAYAAFIKEYYELEDRDPGSVWGGPAHEKDAPARDAPENTREAEREGVEHER